VTVFTVSTNFGVPQDRQKAEFAKALEAIRVGTFLGAPLLRVFAGSPPSEADRQAAFDRAAAGIRRVCEEAAQVGLPVGLQNHNHLALCRTGEEILRMIKKVDHPNLTFLLDTGQWAGSRGASAPPTAELRGADYLESIRQTASLARYVRVKFYNPVADGSEPWIDYKTVFNILRGVHYQGFIDIVYEPGKGKGDPGEDIRTAMPRVVSFLRRQTAHAGSSA
jgi:sugar phosphate isomerase/epimerase